MYLCKLHVSSLWALEVHKFSLTLKPTIWAQDGSRPAEGFFQLGIPSDHVQQETLWYYFSIHFRRYSLLKLKLHCSGHGVFRVRTVTSDLPSGCEQAEMAISTKNIDLNAQERETPGKYKLLLLLCLYQQICYFTMPFGKARSLPEDLDCNTAVPLNSLQLEAMKEQLVSFKQITLKVKLFLYYCLCAVF